MARPEPAAFNAVLVHNLGLCIVLGIADSLAGTW